MATTIWSGVVPGYAIVTGGAVLALVAAVVPHYGAGYRLDSGVLIAGLLPYLVYAVAVALPRGPLTLVGGLAALAIHTWVAVRERIADRADYSDGMIYYVPLVLALALLPLVIAACRKPWPR